MLGPTRRAESERCRGAAIGRRQTVILRGSTTYSEKDFAKAAELYLRVLEAGTTWPTVPYNAACCFALLGRADDAFKYLELAVQRGWSDVERLKGDTDLEPIHSDKRWDDIVRQCAANGCEFRESVANPELFAKLVKRMKADQDVRLAEPPNVIQMMMIDG